MSCISTGAPKITLKDIERDIVYKEYPYEDGGNVILGPDVFASGDGDIITWRNVQYFRL